MPESAVVSLVPESRAPIVEEELPTRPLNERPFIRAEAPAPFYEPPPTSRTLGNAQLSTHPTPEVLAALSKPRKPRRYATAAALVVMFGAGMVAARPTVSDWVTNLLRRPDAAKVAEDAVSTKPLVVVPAAKKLEENSVRGTTPEVPAAETAATLGQSNEAPQGAINRGLLNAPAVSPSSGTLRTQAQQKSSVIPGAPVAERSAPATPAKQTGSQGSLAKLDTTTPAPQAVPPSSTGGAFDKNAAVTALQVAAAQASGCRKAGDPSGMARVVVSFAPSGRVTSATISGPPFAGTQTGGCIASQFRSARVPAFEGALVTVTRSVVIQ